MNHVSGQMEIPAPAEAKRGDGLSAVFHRTLLWHEGTT